MANTTTLPPASSRSPYDPLTVRNISVSEVLSVSADGTDTIDGDADNVLEIYPQEAITLQSNGISAWARIWAYRPPSKIYEATLATDWTVPRSPTWGVIPGLTFTNTEFSGNFMGSYYFPVDVDAGNNENVGFAVRALNNGVPDKPVDVWMDRVSSVRLVISGAVPFVFEIGDVITFEATEYGSGGQDYTMLGVAGGGAFTAVELIGPL